MSALTQPSAPSPARAALPTMYDLPSEQIGEPGMPDEFHALQAILLDETFSPPDYPPERIFSAVDMNLYYDEHNTSNYIRPDWFGVVGVPRLYEDRDSRLSYVVWHEQKAPLIVVELLSPGTQKYDLGLASYDDKEEPTKWEIYERHLRVPYYVVFARRAKKMRAFKLKGRRYVETLGRAGRLWLAEAKLGLGLWQGRYRGLDRLWLRWFDAQGHCLPTSVERAEEQLRRAEHERERAEHERERAEHERERAERLAERLRQLGHDPDQV